MNKRLLLLALLPLLILGSCTKETTETKTTTVLKPYVTPKLPFWGTWQILNSNPLDTSKSYLILDEATSACYQLASTEEGMKSYDYSTANGTDKLVRYDWNSLLPYKISGDTMTVYDGSSPDVIRERMVRTTEGPANIDEWIGKLTVIRKSKPQSSGYSYNTSSSFGIDGDFLYLNNRYSTYKFYKYNTLTNKYEDSVAAPNSIYHALFYRGSSNKLYNAHYSSSQTMKQRVGLTGVNSDLSSNSLSSIRAISMNASSGTIYATRNGIIYSGTEGGNFSSLTTFSGTYPRAVVYYKNDQFLGVYDNTLVLFEISPSLKIIKQYRLEDSSSYRIYESISTNGSDIWLLSRDDNTNEYIYYKVSLP